VKRALLVLVILIAACTSEQTAPTAVTSTLPPDLPTTTTSFTTTTLPEDSCENVTEETAELFEDLVGELNAMTTAEFLDRRRWPERLFYLENAGEQLDARIVVLGCDPGSVQAAAFDRVDVTPESFPAREMVRLLLGEG
jgi:hypothetical protein